MLDFGGRRRDTVQLQRGERRQLVEVAVLELTERAQRETGGDGCRAINGKSPAMRACMRGGHEITTFFTVFLEKQEKQPSPAQRRGYQRTASTHFVGLEEVVKGARVAVALVLHGAAVLAHLVRVEETRGRTLRCCVPG